MIKFICDSNYILFPINNAIKCKQLAFYHNEKMILDLQIALDYEHIDYYAYYDLRRFKDMVLTVTCDPEAYFDIQKTDKINTDGLYTEKYRPGFHFTAPTGWLNDPNGLVYCGGQYHLFYQSNPVGSIWNNMHWGHAVSDNLAEWTHMETALFPDEAGTMFSGSAIVDKKNLLGVKEGDMDTIVLFYTAAGGTSKTSENMDFTQGIAYSTDGGKTFTKHAKNPIVQNIVPYNRDPKVIYHEQTDRYIMALYLQGNEFALLVSKNLLDWTVLQDLVPKGVEECPDFYPLRLDNDDNNTKWLFAGATDRYLVGSFDGYTFKQETEVQNLHYGNSYASQTWSNLDDNRCIRISWYKYDIPGMIFNQAMTFPCEMSLRTTPAGMVLCTNPVKEIENLYLTWESYKDTELRKGFYIPLQGKYYDLSFSFTYKANPIIGITLFGMKIKFDTQLNQVYCNGISAPVHYDNQTITARVLVDVIGMELFVKDGSVYIVGGAIADYNANILTVVSDHDDVLINEINVKELKNIWKTQ